ncbi:hypothetical protein ACTXT7_006267 [Hymenolepis weldensis]
MVHDPSEKPLVFHHPFLLSANVSECFVISLNNCPKNYCCDTEGVQIFCSLPSISLTFYVASSPLVTYWHTPLVKIGGVENSAYDWPSATAPPHRVDLSKAEIEDIKEVFDLFDFWDGRDGLMDAVKVPDVLRCADMNPTIAVCLKHGATKKPGKYSNEIYLITRDKQYKFDEFLPIYQSILKEKEEGTYADFMEAFKTFDREGQGFITAAELRAVLTSYGERLSDEQVDDIIMATKINIDRDGNIRYEGVKILKNANLESQLDP